MLFLCLLVMQVTWAQDTFRSQDDLEGLIYATLDEFLAHPTKENLSIFDAIENNSWRPATQADEHLALCVLYSNEGYYRMKYGQVTQAIQAYEKAWIEGKGQPVESYDLIDYVLIPLANAYSMIGDYSSAESIIQLYLQKAQKNKSREQQITALINLSIVYKSTGRVTNAIDLLRQAEFLIAPEQVDQKVRTLVNLSHAYLLDQQLELAQQISAQTQTLFEQNSVSDLLQADHWSNQASLYLQLEDTVSAIAATQKALARCKELQEIEPRRLAKLHVQLGQLLMSTRRWVPSKESFEKALHQLIPEWNSGLPHDSLLYAENTLKAAMDGMADVLVRLGQFKLAMGYYHKSARVEDQLAQHYNYGKSILLQQGERRQRTEKILYLLYQQYQVVPQTQLAALALQVAEHTKAVELRQQIASYDADSSRRKWVRRQAKIEGELAQARAKGSGARLEEIQQLIDQQNHIRLEANTNGSFQGILKRSLLDLDSLQKRLDRERLQLWAYFVGKQAYYRFEVTPHSVTMHRDTAVYQLKEDSKSLLQFFSSPEHINERPMEYAQVAERLGSQLLGDTTPSQLMVVADGLLNFVPFDALLTETAVGMNYAHWPWLLRQTTLLHHYSAQLYQQQRTSTSGDHKLLGFFPEFAGTNLHLQYSAQEASAIREQIKGQYYSKEKATKRRFMEEAKNYGIIHLSTHASGGYLHDPPAIQFIDSTLYFPEIGSMELSASLMVLGACETGLGLLYQGASPQSLATAFVQVGVKNVLLSLWRVNDQATAELMKRFYQHYHDNAYPYQAIRQAKINYLDDTKLSQEKKSPYYWASFIYLGAPDQIAPATSMTWIWLSVVLGGLLLLLGWYVYKRGLI